MAGIVHHAASHDHTDSDPASHRLTPSHTASMHPLLTYKHLALVTTVSQEIFCNHDKTEQYTLFLHNKHKKDTLAWKCHEYYVCMTDFDVHAAHG